MNKIILTIILLSLICLFPQNSFAGQYSGINLNVDEKPTVMVEDQETMIKKLNNEQPVVKKTIITPKDEKKDEADNYLQYKSNEFINIDAPIKKMIKFREK